MLKQLPEIAAPNWLRDLSCDTIQNQRLPLREILHDALYYPSSGFDGDPVRHLAGNILSFIYVDYGYCQGEVTCAMTSPGFRGYSLIGIRPVDESELIATDQHSTTLYSADDVPSHYRERIKKPFSIWSAYQRQEEVPASHGPSRFSLLYVCSDGVAAFQALYAANGLAPRVVSIIQPGHAFGGNWTDYTDPEQPLAKAVFGNNGGQPDIILYGGYGKRKHLRAPCWPAYRSLVCFLPKATAGSIGIWSRCVPA